MAVLLFLQRTNKISQAQASPYPCSPLSPQLAFSQVVHVGLDPGRVTCRSDSEAQVSQNPQKVKSVINECVPLINGVHVYLQSINYVWVWHGSGPGLGLSLGCKWTWALAQALSLTIVGSLDDRRDFILLSLQEQSDQDTSQLVGCRPCPRTVLVLSFCCQFSLRSVTSLSPCRPKSCTWVVPGIYVRVVIYTVNLTRSSTIMKLESDSTVI